MNWLLGEPYTISAAHGEGVKALMDLVLEPFPTEKEIDEEEDFKHKIKVAIAGRPNAGKSTLINALIGEDRLIAFDMPGTTRDAIEVEFQYKDRDYTLIDTAGLRRKGKVFEAIEKFSVIKTLQAIESSNVVVLLSRRARRYCRTGCQHCRLHSGKRACLGCRCQQMGQLWTITKDAV